jgi:hypothetical protein
MSSWLISRLRLPVTYRFARAINRLVDVLPEFVSAIMPPSFALSQGHFGMRGQTHTHGSSGARFQASALAQSMSGSMTQIRMLGFAGWAGADKNGRHEIFLLCPIDRCNCTFEGLQE